VKIEFVATAAADGATLALPAFAGGEPVGAALPEALASRVARLADRGRFKGERGETLSFHEPLGTGAETVLAIGAGAKDGWDAHAAELFGAHAVKAAAAAGDEPLLIDLHAFPAELAAQAAFGAQLAAYRFDRYRTRPAPGGGGHTIGEVRIATPDPAAATRAFAPLASLAESICFARDLVNEPANVLYPAEFARRVQALTALGLEVEILGEREMAELGMGALLGVGQGSARESQLAVVRWQGAADPAAPPIAFVGKGVCFDTGGISIKPADGMGEMILDMAGAAAVAGAMRALAARKARVNAVGIMGLVENMPDGAAQRPGDIVTTLSGQTVEIVNTDAEGRLVLADALWYCQDRFKPRAMIDLATLTGVIMSALGADIGGLFANDEALAERLLAAAAATDERLWRLPLPADYAKALESRAADLKHTGDRFGGAITATLFLQRFVNDTPWAHLDVGLTVWKAKSTSPLSPDGATGYGVRLLDRLVADGYEDGAA
jgi:leucyl aminopeptidase